MRWASMHIAESVVNRILNAADEIELGAAMGGGDPRLPELPAKESVEGRMLDARLSAAPPAMEVPPEMQPNITIAG